MNNKNKSQKEEGDNYPSCYNIVSKKPSFQQKDDKTCKVCPIGKYNPYTMGREEASNRNYFYQVPVGGLNGQRKTSKQLL